MMMMMIVMMIVMIVMMMIVLIVIVLIDYDDFEIDNDNKYDNNSNYGDYCSILFSSFYMLLCRPIRVPSNLLKELYRNNQNNNNNDNIKIDNNKTMDAHNNNDDKIKQDHKDDHKDDDNDDKMLNRSSNLHKSWNPLYQWLKAKTTSSRANISKRTQAQYIWKQF